MGLAEFFDISLERANDLYAWGWRLSAFGAVITMVGVAALWMGTRVRDRDFETQMTSVNSSSSQALERAGLLEKDAATIRERAANAELKLEQLRRQVAPRSLKRDVLIRALEGQPKAPTEIMYLRDDAESFELAQQIALAMEAAGWQITSRRPIPPTSDPEAITAMAVGGQPSGVTVVASGVTQEEADADFNAMMGKDWIRTPWTVLTRALGDSLGKVGGNAGGLNSPPVGTLRLVVSPRT
jgi:hypothetical protein